MRELGRSDGAQSSFDVTLDPIRRGAADLTRPGFVDIAAMGCRDAVAPLSGRFLARRPQVDTGAAYAEPLRG
jgi:hypothetical protein